MLGVWENTLELRAVAQKIAIMGERQSSRFFRTLALYGLPAYVGSILPR
jgi:hypothetical protein